MEQGLDLVERYYPGRPIEAKDPRVLGWIALDHIRKKAAAFFLEDLLARGAGDE